MKIIQFIPHLRNGGAERLVIDLCNEFSNENDVVLCTFRDIDETMSYVSEISKFVKLKTFGKEKGFNLKLSFRILSFLKRENPDVVNLHLPSVVPYVILSILFLRNISFFHTIHNIPSIEEQRRFFRNIRSILIRLNLLRVIAISDEIAKKFKGLYGFTVHGIIYNGRKRIEKTESYDVVQKELDSYKFNKSTRVFLSVGRLWEQKNHGLLMHTFRRLKSMHVNAILVVIGDDYGTGTRDQYRKEKADNTYFIGSKANVGDYLLNSNVFCLSSKYEGLPITILEAMSIGLPIISTSVGGIPDIIKNGKNGFLSPVDENAYLEVILKFLDLDIEQIERIKQNNIRSFQETHSIEITAKKYWQVYSNHLKKFH